MNKDYVYYVWKIKVNFVIDFKSTQQILNQIYKVINKEIKRINLWKLLLVSLKGRHMYR